MVKLFSKNSNLCDHQHHRRTDRWADGQTSETTCDRETALCSALHSCTVKTCFLADCRPIGYTYGRTYGTVLRPFICHLSVTYMYCGKTVRPSN